MLGAWNTSWSLKKNPHVASHIALISGGSDFLSSLTATSESTSFYFTMRHDPSRPPRRCVALLVWHLTLFKYFLIYIVISKSPQCLSFCSSKQSVKAKNPHQPQPKSTWFLDWEVCQTKLFHSLMDVRGAFSCCCLDQCYSVWSLFSSASPAPFVSAPRANLCTS